MTRASSIPALVVMLLLSAGAATAVTASDGSSPVAEISQAPRIGMWSCWLSNGTRVHAKTLPVAAEPNFSIVLTISGGEILEPPGRRGLAIAAASAWSLPKDPDPSRAETIRRYLDSQVRFRAIAQSDCLQILLSGPEQDLPLALDLARVLIEQPGIDRASFAAGVGTLRAVANEASRDPDRLIIDSLRPLSLPASMNAARPIGLADLPGLESPLGAEAAEEWLRGVLMQGSIEVGIASRTPAPDAIALASEALGPMTTRARVGLETLRDFRDAPPPPLRESTILRSEPGPDRAGAPGCAAVAFLGPHRDRITERRALALATFILDARAEAAFGARANEGRPRSSPRVRTYPANPAARSSASMVAIVVTDRAPDHPHDHPPTDPKGTRPTAPTPDQEARLRADLASLERLITDLATVGPLPDELAEAKAAVARILAEQDLSADAWAIKLGTLTYDGLTPESLADAIDTYQAITMDEVRDTLARWWLPTRESPIRAARILVTH